MFVFVPFHCANAVVTVVPATGYANVTNSLVLHMRFEGNASDSSGRANHGTPAGGPAFVTGQVGTQAVQYATTTDATGTTGSRISSV